ncbi:MAG: hypothetical protein KJ579_10765 [Verrucomicrobia bacterium]|nr:hypothetical protein [Verrucomicrobiota bacterium]
MKHAESPRTENRRGKGAAGRPDNPCDADLRRRIRALLALPMEKRTHFLRVRIGRGSAL